MEGKKQRLGCDNIDAMPQYLIRVHEVSMTSAFWVKASWLQPHIASKKDE
jgi:hypothetical protein